MSVSRHPSRLVRRAAIVACACLVTSQAFSQQTTTNSLGMSLRRIPPGEFAMGSNHSGDFEELLVDFPRSITPRHVAGDERPRHRVRISRSFDMAVHEVTVGQFRSFCEATAYRTSSETSGEGSVGFAPLPAEETRRTGKQRSFQRRTGFNWRAPGFEQDNLHPVVGVSWEDAQAFCRWLSRQEGATYRLPTEAEWEYACRAGSPAWFSFGDSFRGRIQRFANLADAALERACPDLAMRQWLLDPRYDREDTFVHTAPVGHLEANAWGLHDMHGNVWEWCQDRYRETAYRDRKRDSQPVVDPFNDEPQDDLDDWRVIRGGAWCTGPILCRSAARGFFAAPDSACYVGFRVVREEFPPTETGRGP